MSSPEVVPFIFKMQFKEPKFYNMGCLNLL